jgi:2-oxoglutarate dehydrogenase E1 component
MMNDLLQTLRESSALSGGNAGFLEDLYEQYLENPESVEPTWRDLFRTLQNGSLYPLGAPTGRIQVALDQAKQAAPAESGKALDEDIERLIHKQSAVDRLIDQYRMRGHQQARNNPLAMGDPPRIPDLDPAFYGLDESDMNRLFAIDILNGMEKLSLRRILTILRATYCGSIGTEYMYIVDSEIKRWLRFRLESTRASTKVSNEKKKWLLKLLTAAEGIEKYLHRKYVGQKRFSLEGSESLIPLLDEVIQRAGDKGAKEIVIGMAHRGRLNVLINILGKKPGALFQEFEGTYSGTEGQPSTGDVKYHQGFSSDVETAGGPVHLALAFNPSHLEIIDPVVEGSVRARQDRIGGDEGETAIIPLLIHGDAAFAGQGVVMETLNMAETRAFTTGGTIHIVINNQIGFTTSNPFDARSTLYCTDVANMIQAPVFHVNGDDPEAVLFVAQLALDYRMKFKRDVVIDLISYRRHGHNEADEPSVTQPLMYQFIRNHPSVRKIYADKLIEENIVNENEAQAIEDEYQNALKKGETVSRPILQNTTSYTKAKWHQYSNDKWDADFEGAISLEKIRALSEKMLSVPEGFELHPRAAAIMENRRKMAAGALPLDWGYAETLAYATLLADGKNIRLTGQDVARGTFFHRHAIVYNQKNGEAYIPLQDLSPDQGTMYIYDSLLSEEGVLGFEYGYSTTDPETLVIWEAQFGDFANGAQVVIDQFITSGEAKWGRRSGLTMLLPHGYEGQGPEHSSARLERYLQLCADHNVQVCVPSTPAQIFHLLRRQELRNYRKPLIVMSPKSLLRHKLATSTVEELADGRFKPVIGEQAELNPERVDRVVLCAGKVYYDLFEARQQQNLEHVAIVRIEQLYPFPLDHVTEELKRYPNLKEVIWCQEEPENQGAWHQIKHRFLNLLETNIKLSYAGRPMSASPAVGHFYRHIEQQKAVIEAALHKSIPHQEPLGIVHAHRSYRAQSS